MSAPVPPAAAPPAAQRSRGYARWKGERTAQGLRWWVIARGNLSLALASRWVKVILVASLIPGIILSGITFISSMTDYFIPLSTTVLDGVMDACLIFAFLVGAVVGARMISEDRRQGAFLAHFARPVTRWDYVLGKLAALVLPLLFVTTMSGLIVIAADASVDEETFRGRIPEGALDELGVGVVREQGYLGAVAAVLGWGLVASLGTAGVVLGLSALTTRARLAGVAWFAVVAFGWAAHNMLMEVLETDWPALLSWQDNLSDLNSRLLGIDPRGPFGPDLEYHWTVRAGLLLVVAAVGVLLVHLQLRRAEGGVR